MAIIANNLLIYFTQYFLRPRNLFVENSDVQCRNFTLWFTSISDLKLRCHYNFSVAHEKVKAELTDVDNRIVFFAKNKS